MVCVPSLALRVTGQAKIYYRPTLVAWMVARNSLGPIVDQLQLVGGRERLVIK